MHSITLVAYLLTTSDSMPPDRRMENRPPGANPHPGGSADRYHGSINANLVGGRHGTVIVNNASKRKPFSLTRLILPS